VLREVRDDTVVSKIYGALDSDELPHHRARLHRYSIWSHTALQLVWEESLEECVTNGRTK
jgi:hypothetical protein